MQPPTQQGQGLHGWLLSKDRLTTSVGLVLFLLLLERALSFARGIVFARLLGTAEYGIYTLGVFLVPMMATLAGLGIPSAFGRYAARYEMKGGLRRFLSRTYRVTVVLSVLIAGGIIVRPSFFSTLIFGDASHSRVIIMGAVSIPAFVLLRNLSATLMGLKLFRAGRFVESSQVAIYAGVGIALVVASRSAFTGILGLAIATYASVAIFVPLLVRYLRHVDPAPQPADEPEFYRRLLRFTVWYVVTPILAQIFQYVDRFSLQHLMSTSDQGIYSATVNLSETISAIGLAISSVLFPHLSATWEMGNKAKALRDLDVALRVTGIILLVAGLVLVVFGKWFILLLLGPDYVAGAEALPFLVVFYLFTILVWLFGVYPPLIEKTYISAIGFSVAMPCTIVLNLTLIPRLAMVGAAVATMLSYFLMWGIVVAICHKFGLPVGKRTITVCLLPFILLLPPALAAPCVGIVLYVCIRRTWILSVSEREIVRAEAGRLVSKAKGIMGIHR
jgi:O-antigen/teichoic acid export membrane protein